MLRVRRNRHRLITAWVVSVLIVLGSIGGVLWWLSVDSIAPNRNTEVVQTPVKEPRPSQIYSNVLFMGNIFWGRYMNDWSMASPLKTAYPFSRLNEFRREDYNAWIAGLECPTVAGVNMTSAEMEVALQFNCSPDYLSEATKWFTAVTLASNHTDNQGAEGFTETRIQLDKNNIQYFGHYDPRVLEDICEVISLPVTVTYDDQSVAAGKLPIAMCGYHGVFRIPLAESVAVMKQYSQYMPVIAMPHMGAEYQSTSDQLRTNFYHSLIDGGADMVLGDHPHWIQNTESYSGHLIAYSMGNFMFDQQGNTEVERSAAIQVVIKASKDDADLLGKWLMQGEKCSTFHDTCLVDVISQGLSKLDFTFQFGAIGTNDASKITKPATVEQMPAILQRLDWQSTMDQLQLPYSRL